MINANLTSKLRTLGQPLDRTELIAMFEKMSQGLNEYHNIPDEIPWNMLSASAFVNSVSSTTGKPCKKVYIFSHLENAINHSLTVFLVDGI